MAGKVTVGLTSHWPCVTDFSGYPPTGSMAYERQIKPKLLQGDITALPLPFVMLQRYSYMEF